MNIKSFQSFKNRTILEIIICILSLIVGGFLTYDSIYFIYSYNFSGTLYCYMLPMTTLMCNLFIGILLVISGLSFFIIRFNTIYLNKLSGISLILYAINLNLLDFLKDYWSIQTALNFITIPFGIFIYLFFNQKKYSSSETNKSIVRLDIIKLGITSIIYLSIDLSFFNWSYL